MPKFVIVRIAHARFPSGARLICISPGNCNDEDVRSLQATSCRCEAKAGMMRDLPFIDSLHVAFDTQIWHCTIIPPKLYSLVSHEQLEASLVMIRSIRSFCKTRANICRTITSRPIARHQPSYFANTLSTSPNSRKTVLCLSWPLIWYLAGKSLAQTRNPSE